MRDLPRAPVRELDYYPGYYVTVDGRVWSRRSGGNGRGPRCAWLTRRPHPQKGHLRVDLRDWTGRKCTVGVHVLVALAWVGPRPGPEYVVRHLNGRPHDNRACNLAWGLETDNAQDREWHRWHGRRRRPEPIDPELPAAQQEVAYERENARWGMASACVSPSDVDPGSALLDPCDPPF